MNDIFILDYFEMCIRDSSFSLFFLYLHIFCKEDKPLAVFCFLIKADSRDKPKESRIQDVYKRQLYTLI